MLTGVSPHNVIMGGDSAGGNLVASLLLLIRQLQIEARINKRLRDDRQELPGERVEASVAKPLTGTQQTGDAPEQVVDETYAKQKEREEDRAPLESLSTKEGKDDCEHDPPPTVEPKQKETVNVDRESIVESSPQNCGPQSEDLWDRLG